jgi:hypothetical protein|tara:strand:- start:126 stop:467 length:342 start_codon:yes stop_codon:yes gene_type:complete
MLTVTFDDFELEIETTWAEKCDLGFSRVVVLIVNMPALNTTGLASPTVQSAMHGKLIDKINADIGLICGTDYIFQENAISQIKNSTRFWDQRIVIRLQQEEHFAMLKLHYNGN